MTLDDIRAMSKPTILASEAAQVLGCTPQWLRLMAREQPEKPGLPGLLHKQAQSKDSERAVFAVSRSMRRNK